MTNPVAMATNHSYSKTKLAASGKISEGGGVGKIPLIAKSRGLKSNALARAEHALST